MAVWAVISSLLDDLIGCQKKTVPHEYCCRYSLKPILDEQMKNLAGWFKPKSMRKTSMNDGMGNSVVKTFLGNSVVLMVIFCVLDRSRGTRTAN